jgi:hypothetical protein
MLPLFLRADISGLVGTEQLKDFFQNNREVGAKTT